MLILGTIFIVLSNYFRILAPQVTKYVLNTVEVSLSKSPQVTPKSVTHYDPLVTVFVSKLNGDGVSYQTKILYSGIILLVIALISGLFMFLMRQTIIVLTRPT